MAADSGSTIVAPPPQLKLTPTTTGVVAVGIVGAAAWFAREQIAVSVPEAALDFVIRHQALVFGLAGLLVAGLILLFAVRAGRLASALRTIDPRLTAGLLNAAVETRNPAAAALLVGQVLVAPAMLPFSGAALTMLVAATGGGAVGVIPPDTALELPPLTRESTADPSERGLLIFIHGWNGNAEGTWQKFPALVAQDTRFDGYDVWSLGYPTFMFRRQLSVAGVANFFLVQLMDVHHVFDRYRRVIVVAHSMGGLVAREVAIQAALRGRPRAFERFVEVGVPHDGADPAGLASALGISRAHTRDMARGSDFLRDLQTHWSTLTSKPDTFCITSPQDRIVPPASALAQCADTTSYLEGSHTDIVKPETLRDVRYTTPTSRIP